MQVLFIPYATWKQVQAANTFAVYYQETNAKTAWCGNDAIVYECLVTDDADFAANLLAGATQITSRDEAMALIIGVDAVKPKPKVNDQGVLIASPTHGFFEEAARFQGFLITGSGVDTDTIVDHHITSEIYVHGGWFWSSAAALGDYAEFSIVDKDDVLGLFATYGLTPGVDVLELGKYVQKQYLSPAGVPWAHLSTPTVAIVYPGLYMRVKIHTTTEVAVNMGVTYLWFET